jgi:hypothetical protein
MAMADAAGLNAPAGNMRATELARVWRSAGVLRPGQAGREPSKHLGRPRRAWTWKTVADGLPLLRHHRGTPATAQGWTRRSTVAPGTGTRRSPVPGPARRIRLGVCSRRGLSGGDSPRPGAGRDGRTSPAPATSAGHGRTGGPEATRPAGDSQPSTSGPATPVAGSGPLLGCRAGARLLAGPAERGRQGGDHVPADA